MVGVPSLGKMSIGIVLIDTTEKKTIAITATTMVTGLLKEAYIN
jgi:uncharacterized membrane protein YoaK (UPF0700 family)